MIAKLMLRPSGAAASAEEGCASRRILLVDDHQAFRCALSRLILCQPSWQVCGAASCAEEGLRLVRRHRPHLAIIDLRLGKASGFELMRAFAESVPATRLLAYSILDGRKATRLCFQAGAHGFVSKQEPVEALTGAIRKVLEGGVRFPAFDAESADFLELDPPSLA